ncbi:F-box/kelch-repeat protein At2g44130-like [Chenopodium quinoa]|uniref:F-box/kelch-repeat protein At2g44130-like n=1 Tax=Chenopodium quinoa TaxID=63459 RepID=UPI000B77C60D|nr:F-box/kelch-repeat protein At2g44130-like [Chenopodium quinoa]
MGDNYATKSMGFLQFEQLIPGLPDDLAMECLLRVPITSHPSLRLVSHLWKSTVSHPSFFSNRRLARFAENHVFLIQPQSPPPPLPVAEDKSLLEEFESDDSNKQVVNGSPLLYNLNVFNTNNDEWRCLAGVTIPTFSQCVVLPAVRKLVVLGGWDPATLEPVSRVLVLDLAVGTWREGSPMPTARSFFACAAAGPSTVYVAGGHDGQKNALRSAEAYDAVADKWKALPPMAEERDESYGLSLTNEEKFCVISGYGTESQGRFRPDAEVFDPESNTWEIVSGVWPYPGNNPKSTAVVTVEGQRRWWYVLEGEIKEFQWEDKVWKGLNLGSIPKRVTELWSSSSSVSLIDVGNGKIFLMGNGENCGGEGMFILERKNVDNNNNNNNNNCNKGQGGVNWRWQHVHAPPRFFGFPFSASHLLI